MYDHRLFLPQIMGCSLHTASQVNATSMMNIHGLMGLNRLNVGLKIYALTP